MRYLSYRVPTWCASCASCRPLIPMDGRGVVCSHKSLSEQHQHTPLRTSTELKHHDVHEHSTLSSQTLVHEHSIRASRLSSQTLPRCVSSWKKVCGAFFTGSNVRHRIRTTRSGVPSNQPQPPSKCTRALDITGQRPSSQTLRESR